MPVFSPSRLFHGKRVWACFSILFSIPLLAFSQEKPCFYAGASPAATVVRTCVGTPIVLTECTNGGANLRYNYGDGTVFNPNAAPEDRLFTNAATHTYTKPGIYTITQQGTFTDFNGKPGESGGELTKTGYIEVLPTPDPEFSIGRCANYNVRLTITDVVYEVFVVNWGDGTPEQTVARGGFTHAYANANPKTVTVRGIHAGTGCGGSRAQAITPVLDLNKPLLKSLEVTSGTEAKLSFQAEANTTYRIEKRNPNGTYAILVPVVSSTSASILIQSLADDFAKQPITYRIVAFDGCDNLTASDEISTVALTGAAVDGQNVVNWQTNPVLAAQQVDVLRDVQIIQSSADVTLNTYSDNTVVCGNTYCYRVRIRLGIPGSEFESLSNTVCVKAASSQAPAAVTNFKATVTGGLTVLTWDVPGNNTAVRTFFVYRADTSGNFVAIARVASATNRYTDSTARPAIADYCYRIGYADNCGNQAFSSANACPVRLQASEADNGYALAWSPYGGWPDGVQSYEVEKLRADDSVIETETVSSGVSFAFPLDTVNQLLRFRVRAVGTGQTSESNIVEIRQDARIFLPDAFSPNEDAVNDVLQLKGLFISKMRFSIYNRWGEVVYASDNINGGWDGKNDRYSATSNVYAYHVKIEDQLGRTVVKRGNVLLLK